MQQSCIVGRALPAGRTRSATRISFSEPLTGSCESLALSTRLDTHYIRHHAS